MSARKNRTWRPSLIRRRTPVRPQCRTVVSDPEQHAGALGRREGQVEPRPPIPEHAPERLASDRLLSGEHAVERIRVNRAAQPKQGRARADPEPGMLRTAQVIVLDTRAHGPRVRDRAPSLPEVVALLAGASFESDNMTRQPSSRRARRPGKEIALGAMSCRRTTRSAWLSTIESSLQSKLEISIRSGPRERLRSRRSSRARTPVAPRRGAPLDQPPRPTRTCTSCEGAPAAASSGRSAVPVERRSSSQDHVLAERDAPT